MYLVLVERNLNPDILVQGRNAPQTEKIYDALYLDTIEQAYQYHAKYPKSKIYKTQGAWVEIKAEFKEEVVNE